MVMFDNLRCIISQFWIDKFPFKGNEKNSLEIEVEEASISSCFWGIQGAIKEG